MDTNPQTEKQRTQLWAAYQALSATEQSVLHVLSVIYEPITRLNLLHCIASAKVRAPDNRSLTSTSLKSVLDALLAKRFIEENPGRGILCSPLIVELIARELVAQGIFAQLVSTLEEALPSTYSWKHSFNSPEQFIRALRIGVYQNNDDYITRQIEVYGNSPQLNISVNEAMRSIYKNPFDETWFKQLPTLFRFNAFMIELGALHADLSPPNQFLELAKTTAPPDIKDSKLALSVWLSVRLVLARLDILRGDLASAQQSVRVTGEEFGGSTIGTKSLDADIAVLQGDFARAETLYEHCLDTIRKATGKRKAFLHGFDSIFMLLTLLRHAASAHLSEAKLHIEALRSYDSGRTSAMALTATSESLQGKNQDLNFLKKHVPLSFPVTDSLGQLLLMLTLYWNDPEHLHAYRAPLHKFCEQAQKNGYLWIAAEIAEVIGRVFSSKEHAKFARQFREQSGTQTLVDLIKSKPTWEHALTALQNFHSDARSVKVQHNAENRMIWLIQKTGADYSVSPKEQKRTAKGGWTKGRAIALKRLQNPIANGLDYLTEQDLKACGHVREYEYGYYGQTQYVFDDKVLLELIGHPLLFWENAPEIRLELIKAEPQLLVKKIGKGKLYIQLEPLPQNEEQTLIISKETPTRLKLTQVTPQFYQLLNILGKEGLTVPESAQEQVVQAVSQVSSLVTIHSDIGGEGMSNVESVAADDTPHVHLLPFGEGLKMAVLMQPFKAAGGGPYYSPGQGGSTVIAEIEGKRLQTTRDLKAEQEQAEIIENTCSIIHEVEQLDREWLINDPQMCLELLLQLQHIQDDIILEWPEGEKFKLKNQAGMGQFRISIQRENDWFGMQGELRLSQDEVLDMRKLLELLDHSPGRFIKVGDNEFVALTSEFRKRLEDLRGFAEKHGKGARIHPLAAPALEDFFAEVGELETDVHWQEHLQRLRSMEHFQPALPSTLQAELRDYQLEGFQWLARLAYWGVGACLADDMGLGKTLQGLALILSRAPEGPTLVVAPTSVCMNWLSEAQKFAPTLNPLQFGLGERQKMLDELKPFDLLVCSYGLLQQEDAADMLTKVQFQTIVLDEAQAIKNAATKRSQAAMQLQAGFKFITTGTPIENHLGELWNLFRFINPGLLGSLENFNSRFAAPIERDHDRDTRNRLRRLIQPFILRRTKAQVLSELPKRTEITLQVELSKEELAFYEALRQKAMQTLHAMDAPEGQKHLQILAEITRLRRACCNPRLVKSDIKLPSSKLQVFSEVLEELLDNNHKALVFSQFVDHLSLLREYLDSKNIRYQYLDGSTPFKARQESVNAFQAGQGEVFLISLKAGGVGLNLTAADYVIHMDPWWNPAVEDQASDRAHRIGQQRPVTIYRLVAQNTIEEKIVALHHHKRDLADSLLEGSDMSGKLSAQDLLNLLSET